MNHKALLLLSCSHLQPGHPSTHFAGPVCSLFPSLGISAGGRARQPHAWKMPASGTERVSLDNLAFVKKI